VDRIEGLNNPHAVAVDKQGAIYIAEVDGHTVNNGGRNGGRSVLRILEFLPELRP
jgi:hypothetical protein